MAERISRKRALPLSDEDEPSKQPMKKKVRFPKGKKVKTIVDEAPGVIGPAQAPPDAVDLADPRIAAKERAKRRTQMTTELHLDEDGTDLQNIAVAEVVYEDNDGFVDDGIQIEPFNLEEEREEGYFDEAGNFVEYVGNKIKDAWLDSVDADSTYTGKNSGISEIVEDIPDLSSQDIGKIKRRIADLLEPEETVLQALRRLKGTSTHRKEKMPEEVKLMFDQLTEDSMKLMENGDYNVYHERKEVFEREAEGYERLARAKDGASSSVQNGHFDYDADGDVFPSTDHGVASIPLPGQGLGPLDPNASMVQNSRGTAADEVDIFAEGDEGPASNPSTNVSDLGSTSIHASYSQPSSESLHTEVEGGGSESDYVFDESSGYYYSSSLGYYYDPASGFYCSANSGKWYSYNEQTGIYEEVQGAAE